MTKTLYAFGASGDVVGTNNINYYDGMVVPKDGESVRDYYTRYPKARNTIKTAEDGIRLFDCSGLVCYLLRESGFTLDHRLTCKELQRDIVKKTSIDDLRPGDLLFQGDWHVAVYIGHGAILEAAYPWIDSKTYGMRDGVQVAYIERYEGGVVYTKSTGTGLRKWQSFGTYKGFELDFWKTVYENDEFRCQIRNDILDKFF